MTSFSKFNHILLIGASAVGLSACGIFGDHAMPSGYTYHHNEYKSPVAKPSKKVTVEQRQFMTAVQAEQFREATYDLLEKLTMRAGMPPKPVYISAPVPMTTFYANVDNDLRESMRHIGYNLADTPQGAYIFTYEAMPLVSTAENPTANNIQLTLRVFDGHYAEARQLTEETGQYFIQGAHLLEMGPANQAFLKPSGKQMFNKKVKQPIARMMPKKQIMQQSAPVVEVQPVLPLPVTAPAPAPQSFNTPAMKQQIRPPANVQPQKAMNTTRNSVSTPPAVQNTMAPKTVSRATSADAVSSSVQRSGSAPRNSIQIINRDAATTLSAPALQPSRQTVRSPVIAEPDGLPSLAEIEAEIQKLEAEIQASN